MADHTDTHVSIHNVNVSWLAENVNDGSIHTYNFVHSQSRPWIRLDLGDIFCIKSIHLVNRYAPNHSQGMWVFYLARAELFARVLEPKARSILHILAKLCEICGHKAYEVKGLKMNAHLLGYAILFKLYVYTYIISDQVFKTY